MWSAGELSPSWPAVAVGSAPVLTGWMPTSSVAAIFGWATVGALPLLRLRLLAVSHSLRSG